MPNNKLTNADLHLNGTTVNRHVGLIRVITNFFCKFCLIIFVDCCRIFLIERSLIVKNDKTLIDLMRPMCFY